MSGGGFGGGGTQLRPRCPSRISYRRNKATDSGVCSKKGLTAVAGIGAAGLYWGTWTEHVEAGRCGPCEKPVCTNCWVLGKPATYRRFESSAGVIRYSFDSQAIRGTEKRRRLKCEGPNGSRRSTPLEEASE